MCNLLVLRYTNDNIIYGWAVMLLCIHLKPGVVVAINIISIDEENWLNITL